MNRREVMAGAAGLGLGQLAPARVEAAGLIVDDAVPTLTWPEIGNDWTDGLPVANGTLGAMVWSRGGAVVVSLDRGDVWDLRPIPEFEERGFTYANLMRLRLARDTAEIARLFETPFHTAGAGKLPIGRLQFGVAPADVSGTRLHLGRGRAEVILRDGTTIVVWIAADRPLGVVRISGASAATIAAAIRVEAPAFGGPATPVKSPSPLDYGGAQALGYGAPLDVSGPGVSGYASGTTGTAFAVACRTVVTTPRDATVAWTVTSASTPAGAARAAERAVGEQTVASLAEAEVAHARWWRDFWHATHVATGEPGQDRRWQLSTYHLGAAARAGGPPVPLQSPWTWDNGRLPAWKGDYHHDLNTQMTYWPVYAGNRPEVSRNLIDWLWATKPECEAFARSFFGAPGLVLPGTADIRNRPLGGWAAYSFFHTTGAWLLHHFELHWRYFGDPAFLRERAWPYAAGITRFLDAVLAERPGRTGLFLPANISPEVNDNKLESWFGEWTNFDLALVRYAYTASARMADALGLGGDAIRLRGTLARLPDFARDDEGGFAFAPGVPYAASHRHFSHMLAFYPLGLLDPATDPTARRALDASLARLERHGTKLWMGYSFAWLASLYAMAGRGPDAAKALSTFEEGFSGRNGFHTNGDRSGRGITAFPGRLYTLDGGSAALAAVQETLLQSTDDSIRLFPAVLPGASARFERLRARGGADVSATLTGGRVTGVRIAGGRGAVTLTGPGIMPQRIVLSPSSPFVIA